MGMFYLVIIARTDRNGGKCWAATKAHKLLGPREHRPVSGRAGDGEAQAAAQHPRGTGRGRTEVGSSCAQSLAAGGTESSASRLSFETEKKGCCLQYPNRGGLGKEQMSSRREVAAYL